MNEASKLDRKHFINLPDILEIYEKKMEGWKDKIEINGKNIQSANIEQAAWLAYYDQIKVELRTLVDFFDMKVREVRGNLTNTLIKHSQLDLNERTRERMIDAEPEYIKIYQLYLEVKEIYNMADMITNNFLQRAYVLTNLVKIRTADIQDVTLYLDDR